jgi:hypothetical protein
MSRNQDGTRRVSEEQTRFFRTARLAHVRIGRIKGIDQTTAELMRELDAAADGAIQFNDWSEEGLKALLLVRPPVVVGNVGGTADLHWVANPETLLAAQNHWPDDKVITVIALAYQISAKTRLQAVSASLFAACAPALSQQLHPATINRIWQALIKAEVNPLATTQKMNLVRVLGCDPRKLPAARNVKPKQGDG